MLNTLRSHISRRSLSLCALLCTIVALCGVSASGAFAGGSPAGASSKARARVASSYLTGIGDEHTEMFTNPLWTQLHTKIARYIAPYDAAVRPYSLQVAREWIGAAEAAHQQVLVAFYHSEYTPAKMPSVSVYQSDVKKFLALFPKVKQYQPWDEANRGTIVEIVKRKRHIALTSPSPMQSAQYYKALKGVCRGCTILGLDVLDQPSVSPTLRYIAQFKQDIRRIKTTMPSLWGLHNYSDTNRFQTTRTRAVLAAVPGQLWLTETGGIVQFGSDFPNKKGAGLTRAARALSFMFKLAGISSRIKRLYIYDWTGGGGSTRFDAGLMNDKDQPRAGYVVVCKQLHAAKCNVKTVKN
jgi:hypothetical protein